MIRRDTTARKRHLEVDGAATSITISEKVVRLDDDPTRARRRAAGIRRWRGPPTSAPPVSAFASTLSRAPQAPPPPEGHVLSLEEACDLFVFDPFASRDTGRFVPPDAAPVAEPSDVTDPTLDLPKPARPQSALWRGVKRDA